MCPASQEVFQDLQGEGRRQGRRTEQRRHVPVLRQGDLRQERQRLQDVEVLPVAGPHVRRWGELQLVDQLAHGDEAGLRHLGLAFALGGLVAALRDDRLGEVLADGFQGVEAFDKCTVVLDRPTRYVQLFGKPLGRFAFGLGNSQTFRELFGRPSLRFLLQLKPSPA